MDKSDNYFYKLEKAQLNVKYTEYLLQTIRSGLYENGRLAMFCDSLSKRGNKSWQEFIDSIIENPSISSILLSAKKKLGHTFNSIEEVYRTMIMIVENDVFETIIEIVNDISTAELIVYGDYMPINTGKDKTNVYFFFGGGIPFGKENDIIRELKRSSYYSQYHMTVTPDMIMLKL